MALLFTLSTELLILIFTACSSIKTAVHLSGVSRRLHDVWCDNEYLIITTNLKPEIPAFEDAADLAVTEARCLHPAWNNSRPERPRPPPYLWLPSLLRNAEYASIACATLNRFLQGLPQDNYHVALTFTSLPVSYYMIRQLVLAYDHAALRPALLSKLQVASLDTLHTHYELCRCMCVCMDEEDLARQGLLKDRKDWTIEDELVDPVIKVEWDFALDLLWEVLERRKKE